MERSLILRVALLAKFIHNEEAKPKNPEQKISDTWVKVDKYLAAPIAKKDLKGVTIAAFEWHQIEYADGNVDMTKFLTSEGRGLEVAALGEQYL